MEYRAVPGDPIRFVVEDGEALLVSPSPLLRAVSANNNPESASDGVDDVRIARRTDSARSESRWAGVAALDATEARTEDEIQRSLLEQLALSR